MTDRPSDRAYAQAVRELENEPKADRLSNESAAWWLNRRAREIDASTFTVYNHRECPSCGCKSLFTEPPAHRDGCREAPKIDAAPAAQGGAQRPAAWMVRDSITGKVWLDEICVWASRREAVDCAEDMNNNIDGACFEAVPVYTTPPPQDAEDAARYRWLRTFPNNVRQDVYTKSNLLRREEYLDAAIDAARAGEGGG